jgi:two-component system, cell cycle sensor histidine kinase and response regulator CckA
LPGLGIHVTAAGSLTCQLSSVPRSREPRRKRPEPAEPIRDNQVERYRLLLESTVDYAVFHLSVSGIIETWNAGAVRIFGYEASEIIGRHGAMLFTPEDNLQGVPEQEVRYAIETGRAEDSRWHLRKDGSRFWANGVMTALRDDSGTVLGLGKIVRDDTERKRADELLQYQLNVADAIATNAAEALFLVDNEGRTTFANPIAQKMFGWTQEELLGQFLHEKLHCRRSGQVTDPIADCPHMRVLAFGATVRSEDDFFVHKNGSLVPISCSAAPILSDNAVVGAVLVIRDLTEQKQAEATERENEEALQQSQKLESIGVLAGGIAHDFNNLLTGIMGNAGLARRAIVAHKSEQAAALLKDVLAASERAADLTRQLLAYAGKGRFVVQTVDVCKLVSEVSTLIRASISKKITLVIDVPEECPPVEADRTQLQQLVMNLVINGGEAIGDEPGTLTVRVRVDQFTERREQPRTEGFPIAPGEYVRIDVTDTGGGMDAETRARIFEPFFTTKFLGRGLGLSAALGIVRGHRGAIGVRSELGDGTTFTVLLPTPPEARHPDRSSGHFGMESDLQGVGTILVADDEEGVRSLVSNILQDAGYTVELAADGAQAVERLRALGNRVRLILLDLTMPILGGAEAAAELRRIRPDIPIVAMSGYGDIEVMQRFSEVGVDDFVPKPFSPDQLAAKVRDALAPQVDQPRPSSSQTL